MYSPASSRLMPKLVGEAESRDAVDDAEVDGLGAAAHRRVHAGKGHVEHLARRHGMNVEAIGEGLLQLRNVGHMGQHAQFDLAVVGADQLEPCGAMKAARILRPSSVRTGMFCRLGSEDDSRPVEVAAMA